MATKSQIVSRYPNDKVVSVKDFGAVGDGVTDDTTAVQAAGDSLESAGGGTLLLPKGNYNLSFITGWGNVTLLGEGVSSVLDFGATTKVTQDVACITTNDKDNFIIDSVKLTNGGKADLLSLRGCYNSGIKNSDVTMTGTSADIGKGVIISDTSSNHSVECFVDDCYIKAHSSAVFARSADSSHEVYKPKIRRNRLDGSGFIGGGYLKMDIDVRDFVISDNHIDGTDQTDQHINIQEGVIGGQVVNNLFEGDTTATAIRFEEESAGGGNPQDVEDILIEGNTFRAGTGITFRFVAATPRQARNIKIANNLFKDCGRRAINDLGSNVVDSLDVFGNTFDNCGDSSAYQPLAISTTNVIFCNNRTKGSVAISSILTGSNSIVSNNSFQQGAVSGDRVTLASGSTAQNVSGNIGLKTSGYYLSSTLDATLLTEQTVTFTHDVVNNPDLSRMQATAGNNTSALQVSGVKLRVVTTTTVEAKVTVVGAGTGTFNINLFIAPTIAN